MRHTSTVPVTREDSKLLELMVLVLTSCPCSPFPLLHPHCITGQYQRGSQHDRTVGGKACCGDVVRAALGCFLHQPWMELEVVMH